MYRGYSLYVIGISGDDISCVGTGVEYGVVGMLYGWMC